MNDRARPPAETPVRTVRRIRLEEFAVMVSIGIHEPERRAPQRVLIDIDIELADAWHGEGDRIERALDYDFLRQAILGIVKGRHFNLQETLAAEILQACLAQGGMRRVRVATRKPDIYPDCRSIGFEIEATVG
jgi:dihydroneopterin aldolase